MGHLLNPVSFKLNYFSNWVDLWVASNNWLYSEILHNSVLCKNVFKYFFDNGIVSPLGLIYSHCTAEQVYSSKLLLKFYFYDGVLEQKTLRFFSKFRKFNWRIRMNYNNILRRFVEVSKKFTARKFLGVWGFYEYLLVRRIIYFFLQILRISFSDFKKRFILKRICFVCWNTVKFKWRKYMSFRKFFSFRKPISVYSFLNYYLRFLLLQGLMFSGKKVILGLSNVIKKFDLVGFLKMFERVFVKWHFYVTHFRCLIVNKHLSYKTKYNRFLTKFKDVERFSTYFFFLYYKLYLMRFRLTRFFSFFKDSITRFVSLVSFKSLEIEFYGLDNDSVTADFLARFLGRKIEMQFDVLRDLLRPVSKELRNLVHKAVGFGGYKLQFTGRLKRRGRVESMIFRGGRLPLNTIISQIDHSIYAGAIRNGAFCMRVWLFKFRGWGNCNYHSGYWLRTLF